MVGFFVLIGIMNVVLEVMENGFLLVLWNGIVLSWIWLVYGFSMFGYYCVFICVLICFVMNWFWFLKELNELVKFFMVVNLFCVFVICLSILMLVMLFGLFRVGVFLLLLSCLFMLRIYSFVWFVVMGLKFSCDGMLLDFWYIFFMVLSSILGFEVLIFFVVMFVLFSMVLFSRIVGGW